MPTCNFYISVSKRFRDSESFLKNTLIAVGAGGFLLVLILSRLFDPQIIVGLGGKIWFSLTVIVAVIYLSVSWFNPDRDRKEITAKESMSAFMLNLWILSAIWLWFVK
jgi:hypothetical protein